MMIWKSEYAITYLYWLTTIDVTDWAKKATEGTFLMAMTDCMQRGPGTNTGHGHVWDRPDGYRARCGGPALCDACAQDVLDLIGVPQAPKGDVKDTDALRTLRDARAQVLNEKQHHERRMADEQALVDRLRGAVEECSRRIDDYDRAIGVLEGMGQQKQLIAPGAVPADERPLSDKPDAGGGMDAHKAIHDIVGR